MDREACLHDIGDTSREAVDAFQYSSTPTSPRSDWIWRDSRWSTAVSVTKRRAFTAAATRRRSIGTTPFRVLDAPSLRDDYYCSLLAYSETAQCLAVGLGSHIYLWSEGTGVDTPESLSQPLGGHITSLSFSSVSGGHSILAIARADGRLTLWSPTDTNPRFETCQPAPIFCVAFSPRQIRRQSADPAQGKVDVELLLAGDEVGHVYVYVVEWPSDIDRNLFDWHGAMTLLVRLTAHNQQICGLAWSPDGVLCASGGNDNSIYVFETKKLLRNTRGVLASDNASTVTVHNRFSRTEDGGLSGSTSDSSRLSAAFSLDQDVARHRFRINAACKALAFAPWQPTLIAAGGGSNDRCIYFYHALTGKKLAVIDCHSQVTSLTFSSTRKEIAATFGFAQPEHNIRVAVFSWPDCKLRLRIPWMGEERALWAVPYPKIVEDTVTASGRRQAKKKEGRSEGCLVIATSDASIKFHEV